MFEMLDGEDAPMSNFRGRFSYKSVYYRDDDGVQKKIDGLVLMIDNEEKVLVKVYTLLREIQEMLKTGKSSGTQEIILELKK